MRTEDAVAHAIKSTAGVVTSAAVIMVAVFAVLGTLSQVSMKQIGVGLAPPSSSTPPSSGPCSSPPR